MTRLNYDILQEFAGSDRQLELVDLDAARLRDDVSEIHAGDEVAFVATGKLRLSKEGLTAARQKANQPSSPLEDWKTILKNWTHTDVLVEIGSDAEIESDIPMEIDGVKKWLAEHFSFNFLLDGEASTNFRPIRRGDASMPWVATLDTGVVRGELFDVSVEVDAAAPPAPPPALPPGVERKELVVIANLPVTLDDAVLDLKIAVEGPYASAKELQGKTFWLPLEPAHQDVRLVVTVRDETSPPHPKEDPPAGVRVQAKKSAQ
jgi:hypothetical protein